MIRQLLILAVSLPTLLFGQAFENYYAPFHCRIKDTTQMTVSEFGHYVSIGLGGANDDNIAGQSLLISYSLAYKSHIFSFTRIGSGILGYGGGDSDPYFGGNYFGFLFGESIRMKNLFFSLSTGIANYNIHLKYHAPNTGWGMTHLDKQGLSFPIELKLFILARNGIGFGIHVSKNIISPVNFSPFFWGISIVGGQWNKPRVKN